MTARTRWDAIAEELADGPTEGKPEPPPSGLSAEGEITYQKLRDIAHLTRTTSVSGMTAPGTYISITAAGDIVSASNIQITMDGEDVGDLVRVGVLSDETRLRSRSRLRGSFRTPRRFDCGEVVTVTMRTTTTVKEYEVLVVSIKSAVTLALSRIWEVEFVGMSWEES